MATTLARVLAVGTLTFALGALVSGARLTSANTMPGLDLGPWKGLHRGLSTAAAVGGLALAATLRGRMGGWLAGSVLLAALPGGMLEARAAVGAAGVAHAVAASAMTSICAAALLQMSPKWAAAPEATIVDEGSPSLGALAKATWVALLIQTALGALYRHQVLGLLPHVAGAMLAMGMVMYAGIAAFSADKAPVAVKKPALTLLILTGVQMLFGLGAYLYRVEYQEQATGQAAMLTFTVIHVAVGALTTACSALMGMQITRYIRPGVVTA